MVENINKQISFGTNPNNKKQSVFVLIHSFTQPFLHYNNPKDDRDQECLSFIVSNRKENKKGFIGGTVDDGEDMIDALCRETIEEYGIELDTTRLQPLCSHESHRFVTHLFEYKVAPYEFFDIVYQITQNFADFYHKYSQFLQKNKHLFGAELKQASDEQFGISHYYAETRSIEPMFVTNKPNHRANLLKNLFAGSSFEELKIFFDKYNITKV